MTGVRGGDGGMKITFLRSVIVTGAIHSDGAT